MSKFYKVCKYFSNDNRFKILDEKDREDYFQDFMDEWEKRENDSWKYDWQKFIDKLKALYWNSRIKSDMTW